MSITNGYELKLEQFSGPIEKLLELIEEKKLEITQLSLARVTADFLAYLATVEKVAPGILADFLVVASQLLLIKSKALLPNLVLEQEEEQEIKSLEERLKIYQEIKTAKNYLKNFWRERPLIFSREFLASSGFSFYPPKNLKPDDLKTALGCLLKELRKFIYETRELKLEVINLAEKMEEFLKRFKAAKKINFSKVIDSRSKTEIITYFLVVLHLIKDRLIWAQQNERFSEITVERLARKSFPAHPSSGV